MRSEGLAPELRELIYRCCPSVTALTLLLHLQAGADRTWTPRDVCRTMSDLDVQEAGDMLAAFYGLGLLAATATDTYVYEPRSSEVARLMAMLAEAYALQPTAVLEEITTLASVAPLRRFADAFVIKGRWKRG
jgi:hypothetical protein